MGGSSAEMGAMGVVSHIPQLRGRADLLRGLLGKGRSSEQLAGLDPGSTVDT